MKARCNKPACTNFEQATYVFILSPGEEEIDLVTLRCTKHMAEHISRRDLTNEELTTVQKILD